MEVSKRQVHLSAAAKRGAELKKMTWLLFVLSALTCSGKTIGNKRLSGSAENRHLQDTGCHETTVGEARAHTHM